MSSQRITRSSVRTGLRSAKMETTMTLKRGGSLPVKSTRPPSKELREERMKKLLQPFGGEPTLDATNNAKRIIELEHELLHGKKSKREELELELAGAKACLQAIIQETKEEREKKPYLQSEEDMEIEDEDMIEEEEINNEEIEKSEDENIDTEMEEETETEDPNEAENTPSETLKGDFVTFKPAKKSSLQEATEKGGEVASETKEVVEVTQSPQKTQNPYAKKETKKSVAWGKSNGLQVVLGESMKKNNKSNNTFRVRATYKTNQADSQVLTLHMELHRILIDFSKRAKKVDPECEIMVWNSVEEEDYVAHDAKKLAPTTAAKYVGLPMNRRNLRTVKNRMGFKVSSKLTLYQFIDAWTKMKGMKDQVYISEAEMQSSPTAFAVGLCQGSSPKKVTKLLNEKLAGALETNIKVEASWQIINKDDLGNGIVEGLWKQANEKSKDAENKRLLNLYNPSGLIIYVSDITFKRKIKAQLQKMYGHGSTVKDWALWPDGSVMRFIPFIASTAKERNIEKVTQMLRHHIHCKADERARDLEAVDLFTPKEYLEGKSLHEAILSIQSKKMAGQPIFRHITRKWTRNHMEYRYSLTSYSILAEEADVAAESLMSIMHDQYGNEVLKHFPTTSLNISQNFNEYRQQFEEEDPILEDLLDKVEIEIDYELTPDFPFSEQKAKEYGLIGDGQSTIQTEADQNNSTTKENKKKKNESKKSSRKNKAHSDGKNQENTQTEDPYLNYQGNNQDSSEESMNTNDSLSMLTDFSDPSEEDTVKTGKTKASNSSEREWREKRSIQRKLEKQNFKYEDVEKWTEENPDTVKVIENCHSTKYKQLCSIITAMAISESQKKTTNPNNVVNNVEDAGTPSSSSHPT